MFESFGLTDSHVKIHDAIVPGKTICIHSYVIDLQDHLYTAYEAMRDNLHRSAHDASGCIIRAHKAGDEIWRYFPPFHRQKPGERLGRSPRSCSGNGGYNIRVNDGKKTFVVYIALVMPFVPRE